MVFKNQPVTEDGVEKVHIALGFLEKFLEGHMYSCGDEMTVADMHFAVTILAMKIFWTIEEERYPNITAWLRRMQSLPYFWEMNGEGNEKLRQLIQGKLDGLAKQ